jgi:predicted metal-dependent enzyme (double-stranded beta helix superfamily)
LQTVQAAITVQDARRAAIADTIARIREVEAARGVNRDALKEIRALLLELASHQELFPPEDFPAARDEKGFDTVYRLAEDGDHRFALYMSTGTPGKKVPPHNHTTWAVIVGVEGAEENFFYRRDDLGETPGRAQLTATGGKVVRPGTGVCLMPDDIHHIQVTSDTPTMHLHMYGYSLERLPNRVVFNMDAGTVKQMVTTPNIREAR